MHHRLRRSLQERTSAAALTLMRQAAWGQQCLFGAGPGPAGCFRVTDGTAWGPPTTQLALAAVQARAVALAGGRALIVADDGTAAVVTHGPAGFEVAADADAAWPATVRSVLSRHG